MKIFNRITLQTLKKAKSRTIVSVIGVVVAACLFTAISTFTTSMFVYMESIEKNDGDYHIRILDENAEAYKKLKKDKGVDFVQKLDAEGRCVLINGNTKHSAQLYSGKKEIFDTIGIQIVDGRLPEKEGEIIVHKTMTELYGEDVEIGTTLSMPVTQYKDYYIDVTSTEYKAPDELLGGTSYAFKIVGIYEGRDTSNIYTYTDKRIANKYSELYVKYKKKLGLKPREILQRNGLSELDYRLNWDMLLYSGSFYDMDYAMTYISLVVVLVLLVAVATATVISCTFKMSINERARDFGLLSTIGATKKQLRSCMRSEAMYISIIGIPIGVILGMASMWAVVKFLGGYIMNYVGSKILLEYKVSWETIAIGIIFTVIVVYVSLALQLVRINLSSPIEEIKQARDIAIDIKKKSMEQLGDIGAEKVKNLVKKNKRTKETNIEKKIAKKYYTVSNKRFRITVFSLAFSMAIFITCISLSDTITENITNLEYGDMGYDIRITDEMASYTDPEAEQQVIAKYHRIKNEIKSCEGLASGLFMLESHGTAFVHTKDLTDEAIDIFMTDFTMGDWNDENISEIGKDNLPQVAGSNLMTFFIDNETYLKIVQSASLDESKYIGIENPPALLYNKMDDYYNREDVLKPGIKKLNILDERATDKPFNYYDEMVYSMYAWPIFDMYIGEPRLIISDSFMDTGVVDVEKNNSLKKLIGTKDAEKEGKMIPIKTKSVEIGDYIESLPFEVYGMDDMTLFLIYPESAAYDVNTYNMELNVRDYDKLMETVNKVMDNNNLDKEYCLEDNYYDSESKKSILLVVKVFAYGFSLLIFIMAMTNVFNTVVSNIILRRREFATLRSIGFDSNQIKKVLGYECNICRNRALVLGGIMSLLGVAAICMVYNTTTIVDALVYGVFAMPYIELISAIAFIFVVVHLAKVYAFNKIKDDDILDILKDENI